MSAVTSLHTRLHHITEHTTCDRQWLPGKGGGGTGGMRGVLPLAIMHTQSR